MIMTYQEVLENARKTILNCKVCTECNGLACGNTLPGPGSKALALGADAVMICRPFAVAWFGGDAEGIKTYVEKLREEFTGAMYMVGARKLADLCPDMVR